MIDMVKKGKVKRKTVNPTRQGGRIIPIRKIPLDRTILNPRYKDVVMGDWYAYMDKIYQDDYKYHLKKAEAKNESFRVNPENP